MTDSIEDTYSEGMDDSTSYTPKQNRFGWLTSPKFYAALAILLLVFGGLWFLAKSFQSPEQREAQAEPPEKQPIVVPVTKGDLRDDFTVNATAAGDTNLTYPLPLPGDALSVVTRAIIKPGDTIYSGVPIVEINDKPIIVLSGKIPMYRDITPGLKGGDVARIQVALNDLGYNISADGIFGPNSQEALRKHYKALGYVVPTCPKEVYVPSKDNDKKEDNSNGSEDDDKTETASFRDILNKRVFMSGDVDQKDLKKLEKEDEKRKQDHENSLKGFENGESEGPLPPKEGYDVVTKHFPCLKMSDVLFMTVQRPKVISAPDTGEILSGDTAKLVLSDGTTGISATIPATEMQAIELGSKATATYQGQTYEVTVSSIVEEKKKEGEANTGFGAFSEPNSKVTFIAKEPGVFDNLGSGQVLLSVPRIQPVIGHLIVPQRAISQDASGRTSVLVQRSDEFVAVPIEEVQCIGGQCAINSPDGQVTEGMMVRVDQA